MIYTPIIWDFLKIKILILFFRLQSFHRKYDTLIIALVFDSRGMPDSGPGYRHPKRDASQSDEFSLVVTVPQVKYF